VSETGNWVRVAAVSDVAEGSAFPVQVAGLDLAVYHLAGGAFYCTDNICTHAFALLTDGWLEGCMIECPLHAGQFDVRDGKGQGDPIDQDLKTFPIRVEGDALLVQLSA
jgi:nitrite reductase/ring-hydroxylating ferredoxin subunit